MRSFSELWYGRAMDENEIEEVKEVLGKAVSEAGVVGATMERLRAAYPEREWSFTGDHCLHQDELFMHFAEHTERRMWWVRVDDDAEVAMSWNMEGMSDLV